MSFVVVVFCVLMMIEQVEADDCWYVFNDSEVRRFDAVNNLASECFGGNDASSADLTTGLVHHHHNHHHHQHDKSNSAYMLFYERRRSPTLPTPPTSTTSTTTAMSTLDNNDPALFRAILDDNRRLLADTAIYEPRFFELVWQMCTRPGLDTLAATQLAARFLFDVYVHARNKPRINDWCELIADNVRKCRPAAAWLIAHSHSASSSASSWSHKFLVKCPIGALRLIMQRLLALAIVRLLSVSDDDAEAGIDGPLIVGAFVRSLLDCMDPLSKSVSSMSSKPSVVTFRWMSEYLSLLLELTNHHHQQQQHQNEDEDEEGATTTTTAYIVRHVLVEAEAVDKLAAFYLAHRSSSSSTKAAKKKKLRKQNTTTTNNNNNEEESNNEVTMRDASSPSSISSDWSHSSSSSSSSDSDSASEDDSSSDPQQQQSAATPTVSTSPDISLLLLRHRRQRRRARRNEAATRALLIKCVLDRIFALIARLLEHQCVVLHRQLHFDKTTTTTTRPIQATLPKRLTLDFFKRAIYDQVDTMRLRVAFVANARLAQLVEYQKAKDAPNYKPNATTRSAAPQALVRMCAEAIKRHCSHTLFQQQDASNKSAKCAAPTPRNQQQQRNKLKDRCVPFFNMMASSALGFVGESGVADMDEKRVPPMSGCDECTRNSTDGTSDQLRSGFGQLVLAELETNLLKWAPFHTLQVSLFSFKGDIKLNLKHRPD